ncbi:MAG: LysR family transcriptional regulator [Neisseriaceae bacterium]|nr:LysR family transcriptional regulator [Neisseriaceae bacterium]MBP6860962.1 LysR family transcriptional regulator [Neisseriaceae bacterium]
MHFNLVDLRVFVNVAQSPSLTQGAKKAFVSPASASTRIKGLEQQLGSRLFYRHNKGLDLTPAGERLLQHARVVLRQVEHIKSDFSGYASDQSGHVRVFANTTAVTEFLPEILAGFLAERPLVTIDLQEQLTKGIFRGVIEGAADIGVVAGRVPSQGLETIHFSTDRLVLVTPRGHALAQGRPVKFKDTLEYAYIGLQEGSTLQAFLQEQQAALGMNMATRIHLSSFEAICRLIEVGVGVGVVPESAAKRHRLTKAIDLVDLDEAWAVRERSIVVKEQSALTPLARALIKEIVTKMA